MRGLFDGQRGTLEQLRSVSTTSADRGSALCRHRVGAFDAGGEGGGEKAVEIAVEHCAGTAGFADQFRRGMRRIEPASTPTTEPELPRALARQTRNT